MKNSRITGSEIRTKKEREQERKGVHPLIVITVAIIIFWVLTKLT